MRSRHIVLFCLLIVESFFVEAQDNGYQYRRTIEQISKEWHIIDLPDELFGKIKADYSDVRVIGITGTRDTIEAPFIFRYNKDQVIRNKVQFNMLNRSKVGEKYFFTFEIPEAQSINEINLDFDQKNYDWHIILQGSQDQVEWFEVLDNYRILSIQNDLTDYSFSKLNLPQSDYRYYRLQIDSEIQPKLASTSIMLNKAVEGIRENHKVNATKIHEDKNRSILDIFLNLKVPISSLKIDVKNKYDYYRPITIQYLADSFNTEKGWKYQYRTLASGTLSSMEKGEFNFKSTILSQVRIIVQNHDNEPLEFGEVDVWDYSHTLVARFSQKADYSMIYGNPSARRPNYDIAHFTDQIPTELVSVQLGKEQQISSNEVNEKKPFFENKAWLWAVLILIIALLGYFSVKMLKKN